MTRSSLPFIACSGLVKIFRVADLEVVALQGLDLEVQRGEIVALVGPSGSGKSTLLAALGGLDRPTAGKLEVDGQDLLKFNRRQLTTYRREQVGFVWQQTARNLLPYLSARDNIMVLMQLAGWNRRASRARTNELLEAVGMEAAAEQLPTQLSGGQQQRLSLACALANAPRLLLADEPTGEIDWPTAQRILSLMRDLRERYHLTIIMATHDPRVAEAADRVIAIRDGRTSTEVINIVDAKVGSSPLSHSSRPHAVEELVVLDRSGRLQIPSEQRALAKIGRRVRLELVEGGILIRPGDDEGIAGHDTSGAPDGVPDKDKLYHWLYDTNHLSPSPPPPSTHVRGWLGWLREMWRGVWGRGSSR